MTIAQLSQFYLPTHSLWTLLNSTTNLITHLPNCFLRSEFSCSLAHLLTVSHWIHTHSLGNFILNTRLTHSLHLPTRTHSLHLLLLFTFLLDSLLKLTDRPTYLTDWIILITLLKPKSDIHSNRSATSPRPKFITIAEVAEESQLGFAVGRRLVGDWSATDRRLVGDLVVTSLRLDATSRRPVGDQVNLKVW